MKRLFQTLVLLLAALMVPTTAVAAFVQLADGWYSPAESQARGLSSVGDLNNDDFVNMDDLTIMINYLLTNDATGINLDNADTNLMGGVTMDDLTALINYLLTNVWPWAPVTETFTVNGVTFKMVAVEGGSFTMGATAEQDSDAYDFEYPTHQVTLSTYSIGETEVTQELWQAVMDSNPSWFSPRLGYVENLQRPVERVTWNDCQEFITKLNQMTGKTFRLPTEAEWEYAARGGNKSQGYKYAGSNDIDAVAWYWYDLPSQTNGTEGYGTQCVATKAPNELGLYDMSGNVWECCQDWYGDYSSDAQTNPTGPASGSFRVIRGGGWNYNARGCRVSYRNSVTPSVWNINIGLRLALDEENSPKFRLSETVVEIEEGRVATVDVLNGSGSYSLAGGASIVTAAIDGEKLMVTGIALGTNTVYVTDDATGATAVLTVIVKEFNDETFTVNGVTFKMVAVEGGTFTMGASDDDPDADDNEKPAHEVTLSSYSIGETEVTQALWQAVIGTNPSCFAPTNGYAENLQRPVEQVSWNTCQEFITKLNQMTGKNFRLPTEAEWEYAARGGNKSQGYKYAGSNTVGDVAWYERNSSSETQTVATKAPNELGLYDMSGNVWEWCQDWYGSYSSVAQTNPTGPSSGSSRVARGGAWGIDAWFCRVSLRGSDLPTNMGSPLGFRLAL